jgi:hypothetical protein
MGYCPGSGRKWSLERIENSKGYEPGNCKWATAKEQANNRRKRRWGKRPKFNRAHKKQKPLDEHENASGSAAT